jgi:hypothetical protein
MSLTGRNLRRRIAPIAALALRAWVDPRSLRTMWLRSLSHVFDRQSRSAATLYLMRQFIDFAVIVRRFENTSGGSLSSRTSHTSSKRSAVGQ